MTWHSVSPDGTKSVKSNRIIVQDNTTHLETCLNLDHFWNNGVNDGYHQKVGMPKQETGGLPTDPAMIAGIDGIVYYKQKTVAESAVQQDVNPFYRNASAIMQLLGIRACCVFNVAGGIVSIVYSHNCTVARTGTGAGRFTASFTSDLPSENYLFEGSGIAGTAVTNDVITCAVEANATMSNVKTAAFVKFRTVLTSGSSTITRTSVDPVQAWFYVFGG